MSVLVRDIARDILAAKGKVCKAKSFYGHQIYDVEKDCLPDSFLEWLADRVITTSEGNMYTINGKRYPLVVYHVKETGDFWFSLEVLEYLANEYVSTKT